MTESVLMMFLDESMESMSLEGLSKNEMVQTQATRQRRRTRRSKQSFIPFLAKAISVVLVLLSILLRIEWVEAQGGAPPTPPRPPNPSPVFSPNPTRSPTRRPTRNPTNRPSTLRPTRRPTARPTTSRPTRRPTLRPTRQPTFVPTLSPTLTPTATPTTAPTRQPTPRPTPVPTRQPTSVPTISPTPRPTATPTLSPTSRPTVSPSIAPSGAPSESPTLHPTTLTPRPTVSAQPSPQPSYSPTDYPSASPSDRPSAVPSFSPTGFPSSSPSSSPSLPLQREFVNVDTLLWASTVTFENQSALTYEQMTANFIKSSILNRNLDPPVVFLFVDTKLNSQRLIQGQPNGTEPSFNETNSTEIPETVPDTVADAIPGGRRGMMGRGLQEPDLKYLLTDIFVQIDYRSMETYNVIEWIGYAFNSEEKRNAYIDILVRTGDPSFQYLQDVELLVNGTRPEEPTDPPSAAPTASSAPDNTGKTIGIAVGAALGGLLLLLLAFYGYRRYFTSVNMPETTAETTSDPTKQVTTEILVANQGQDDISTLGDPYYGPMGAAAVGERDERTASVGGDYDYTRQYMHGYGQEVQGSRQRLTSTDESEPVTRVSSTQSGITEDVRLGPLGKEILSDEKSFEEQYAGSEDQEDTFEVEVPPGKLGMVIDTPNGGLPAVHALKSESVLADRVTVGDRLLSVDGEDVTRMTAIKVSKLISAKEGHSRVLVFSRGHSALDLSEH